MADNETGNITEEEGAGRPVGEDEAESQTEEEGKSSKKVLIIKIAIAVLVILLAAGGGYFFFMSGDESEPIEDVISEEQGDVEVVDDEMSSEDTIDDEDDSDYEIILDEDDSDDEDTDSTEGSESLEGDALESDTLEETDLELEDVLIPEESGETTALEEENRRLKQEMIDLKSQRENKTVAKDKDAFKPDLEGYYFDERSSFRDGGDSLRETTEEGGLEPKWGEFKRAK